MSRDEFSDKIHMIVCFDGVVELDYIGMLEHTQQLDFPTD